MAHELAIIGAGNMAEAIARGLLSGRVFTADQLVAADVSPQRRDLFSSSLKIQTHDSPAAAAKDAQRILLSVKPQNMKDVLVELKPVVTDQTLIISIAAGISSRFIEQNLSPVACHVIRTMPNTPMLVGQGMVAMAAGSRATKTDLADAHRIFAPAASVIEVSEDKLDAVTALSGSGPAYFFLLVEHMIRAGVEMGLSSDEAHILATKTALGAATMLTASSDSPAELRRKVTSPKGTTHEAITYMEQHNLPQTIVDALKAAQRRSRELGS
ncbi:MAG TPA: pyrroline-5-carboxylate reductase [Tepidisphaeraceae bacterium]|nr:pyrroline-5-carboxylate reductase [Tepidisphaeraceae bacterium]